MIANIEYDEAGNRQRIGALRDRGVRIWSPDRVFVAADVPLDFIEPGAILMNAVICGPATQIGAESAVGVSGIAVLSNVCAGRRVELGAGSYSECVMLDDVRVRGCAEIRGGTVMEEEAEAGHSVGLKNTFFGTAVVAGSSINYCDVFVTGGTSRKDHSEIGSGAVHFNFAPTRDKFGSLFGDVTGLLLQARPIFVGGNTGLVAPGCLPFGAVVAAGVTLRHATAPEDQAMLTGVPEAIRGTVRKCFSTVRLLANLSALYSWYEQVRLACADQREAHLYRAIVRQIRRNVMHRKRELQQFLSRTQMDLSPLMRWLEVQDFSCVRSAAPTGFVQVYHDLRRSRGHTDAIRALSSEQIESASRWLSAIVRAFMMECHQLC